MASNVSVPFEMLNGDEQLELPKPDPLLDRKISSFTEFGTRIKWCLTHNDDIMTMRDLTRRTGMELLRIPNFGRKSLREIEQVLEDYGLSLHDPDKHDGTMPLPFPSMHERLSRIEQRLDALERHPLLRVVGQMR